ncbi:hypothetical protein K2P97_06635 [bacterium]|nr:hypothetical protein [bacterium]
MDRVLLIIDDIQYSRHVEMTLRKVGFDVESINNEFNVGDTLLTFNPDYVVCRGNSSRLSTLNVGRKLKESNTKFIGKVVLIFQEGLKVSPDDLIKLKMDLLLFEPISTLRLAVHLFSMSGGDFEFVKDKLLKFAITDNTFRNYEQQMLKYAGLTIDSEIQIVSSMDHLPAFTSIQTTENVPAAVEKPNAVSIIKSDAVENGSEPIVQEGALDLARTVYHAKSDSEPNDVPIFPQPEELSEQSLKAINEQIQTLEDELPLRIESYNRAIGKVDQDLNMGLKKRQTKKASNKLHKDLIDEGKTDKKSEQEQDDEKVRFANALFKKK